MHAADVLIPAYNAAATLAETIASVQAQTFDDFVVHIVDDGSTDGTSALAHRLAAGDPRIRVHDKPNGGIVSALNHGLTYCEAEFLVRIDADDLAYPDRFAVQIAYLRAHPDVVGVGAGMRHIDADGVPLGTVAILGPTEMADPLNVPCIEPYLIHPAITVRRAAIAAVGGYREVHMAEDSDLYWRLLGLGRLVNLPELLGDYRMHGASLSGTSTLNGRIMSISSQLSAVSELRRRRGQPDIPFDRADLANYRRLVALDRLVAFAGERLAADERPHFARAVAAKLIELTSYRPYELDSGDCAYIGTTLRGAMDALTPANRAMLQRQLMGAASRVASTGRLGDALALLTHDLYPGFAARTLARIMLPEGIRRRLRRSSTRDTPVK